MLNGLQADMASSGYTQQHLQAEEGDVTALSSNNEVVLSRSGDLVADIDTEEAASPQTVVP